MSRLQAKRLSFAAFSACLAVGLWLAVATGCIRYYRWESQKQNPGKADVLIVPGMRLTEDGRGTFILHNRVAMATHLIEAGYAPKVIVTGGNPQHGVTEAEKMKAIAVELGIAPELITTEPKARSTVENAKFSAELMVEAGWHSALVVTDPPHLGYALPVFRDAFEERELTLYWLPVDYALINKLGIAKHPDDPPK